MTRARGVRILVAVAAACGVLGAMAAIAAKGAANRSAEKPAPIGKKIFAAKCVVCHKSDGSGGIRLTGNPTPNWRDARRMADPRYDDAYLRDCITNGKMASGMVAWGKTKQLEPAEIESLIVHIRSFAKRK